MAQAKSWGARVRRLPPEYQSPILTAEALRRPGQRRVPSGGFLRLLEAENNPELLAFIAVGGQAIPGMAHSKRLTEHMSDLSIGGPEELPKDQREALLPLRAARQVQLALAEVPLKVLVRPESFMGLPTDVRGPEADDLRRAVADGLNLGLLTGHDGPLDPLVNYCLLYTAEGPAAYAESMAFETNPEDGTLGRMLYDRSRFFEVGSIKAEILGAAALEAWARVDNDDGLLVADEFLRSTAAAR